MRPSFEAEINVRPPFDFAATVRFMRFTEAELVDTLREGIYARAVHLNDKLGVLAVAPDDPHDTKKLTIDFQTENEKSANAENISCREEAAALVRRIFSADHDLAEFQRKIARDKLIREIEMKHRGLRLPCWASLFEALTIAILSQQISTHVAMTLKRRIVARFGERIESSGEEFYSFPLPQALARIEPEELRAFGLSTSKAQSVVALARHFDDGAIDEQTLALKDNETVIARLVELRGVGRWTAEWALMLYFARTDVFPAGDLALRGAILKFYARFFETAKPSEREVREFARRRWGAWQSYVALYILAALRAGTISLRAD